MTALGVEMIEDNLIYNIDRCTTFILEGNNEMIEPLNSYITIDGYVLVIISPLVGPTEYQFEVKRG